MKCFQAVLFLGVFAPWTVLASDKERTTSVRRATGYYMRSVQSACRVVKVAKTYEGGVTEEQLECQLTDKDLLDGEEFRMVRVKGLAQTFIDEARSGETMLLAPGAILDGASNELIIPAGGKVELNHVIGAGTARGEHGRRLAAVGNKEVLVIRESRSTYSEAVISDEIFGTGNDEVNLVSQYAACSYGQLTFSKWTGNALVKEGVLTVSISNTIIGADQNIIRNAMVSKAAKDLGGGSLNNLVDYVMVCMPKGTTSLGGGWVAYAYIDHWLSVYNDKWCNYPSSQLHEIGHNFKMAHSGNGSNEYDDQSGMMGYSYGQDETPRMCFNGAKTYQFGWFSERHVDLPLDNTNHWSGDLIGFAEREAAGGIAQDRMIVRIRQDSSCGIAEESCDGDDYYVHFNRKVGFNAGTLEGANQVLVSTRSSGLGYKPSWLVSRLDGGEQFTVADFHGSGINLTISVATIDSGTPRRASVTIQIGDIKSPSDWESCNDDDIGLFSHREKQKSCDWLRFRAPKLINSLCQDSAVSALCTETCGLCTDDCRDDTVAKFQIDNKIGDKDCRWVAKQQERKDLYCHADHVAFYYCRESCESCDEKYDSFPSSAPSETLPDPLVDGACKDDDFWPFYYGKHKRDCVWLRRRSPSFRPKVCVPGDDAYWACEDTCGRCTRNVMPGNCNNNGVCDVGENCDSCPDDCRTRHHATNGYCCVGGECGYGCNALVGDQLWKCIEP